MREGVLFLPATRDKDILQEMLEAEIDVHLGYSKGEKPLANSDNTRNGYSSKTVRSELGPIELDIPRNRKGEYNLKIVPKYSRDVSGIEEKVTSLYARGMSTRDIHEQIEEPYGVKVSAETIWKIIHKRWDIENNVFNQIKTKCHFDYCYVHSRTGTEAIVGFMMIAFNLSRLYFFRNIRRFREKNMLQIDI